MEQMTITKTEKRKMNKYSVTLRENDKNSCTYKIDQKLFDTLKKYLEPFRSLQPEARKIRCIETGKVFDCARKASEWLEFITEREYCNMDLIKQACRKKNGSSYGYHWEFADKKENDLTEET